MAGKSRTSCNTYLSIFINHLARCNTSLVKIHDYKREVWINDINETFIFWESVNNIARRSTPKPHPPVGAKPYSRAVQNVSSKAIASSSPDCRSWYHHQQITTRHWFWIWVSLTNFMSQRDTRNNTQLWYSVIFHKYLKLFSKSLTLYNWIIQFRVCITNLNAMLTSSKWCISL